MRAFEDKRATAIRCALMAGLIAVVVEAAITALGITVNGTFLSLTSQWP